MATFNMHGGSIHAENMHSGTGDLNVTETNYHSAAPTSESPSTLPEQEVSSFSEDYYFREDLNFRPEDVAKLVPNKVDQETYEEHFENEDEIYSIRQPEKKQALILNMVKYKTSKVENRKGAQEDTKNLKAQLLHYGFKDPVAKENLTEKEIKKHIDDFLTSQKVMDAPVVLLYIGSHGGRVNNLDYFVDVNGTPISIREVIKTFALSKYKRALSGKPKLFLLDFCRSESDKAKDQADSVSGQSPEMYNPRNLIDWFKEVKQTATDGNGNALNWKDMFLSFSTTPGAKSYRDIETGTWFVNAICTVFSKDACKEDWASLFTKVNQAVVKRGERKRARNKKMKINTKNVYPVSISETTLRKKLFLFPQ